jgi:hypothetical protein
VRGLLTTVTVRWSWYGESTASAKGRAELRTPCGDDPCYKAGLYKATAQVRMTKPRSCTTGPAAGSRFFIVISCNGKPVARPIPVRGTNSLATVHGALRGEVRLADDFDELPDDIAEAFDAR